MFQQLSKSIQFRSRHLSRCFRINMQNRFGAFLADPSEDRHSRFARELVTLVGSIRGKIVLEIGTDSSLSMLGELVRCGVDQAIGVNPLLPKCEQRGNIRLINGDARCLPLQDDSTDIVVSIASFQHVFGLTEVIDESFRVLRKDGYLYAEFGPVWSSIWGHSLWLDYGGQVVNFKSHKLPPYAHLLMTQHELHEWCTSRFGDKELAAKISDYIFNCPDRNKLFFSDFEEMVLNSKFQTLLFIGFPDIPGIENAESAPTCEHLANLRRRFPDKNGFGYHVIRLLLKKQ
jgi:SAM-dependent methyltransferase